MDKTWMPKFRAFRNVGFLVRLLLGKQFARRALPESSPGGASQFSPALQRGVACQSETVPEGRPTWLDSGTRMIPWKSGPLGPRKPPVQTGLQTLRVAFLSSGHL